MVMGKDAARSLFKICLIRFPNFATSLPVYFRLSGRLGAQGNGEGCEFPKQTDIGFHRQGYAHFVIQLDPPTVGPFDTRA